MTNPPVMISVQSFLIGFSSDTPGEGGIVVRIEHLSPVDKTEIEAITLNFSAEVAFHIGSLLKDSAASILLARGQNSGCGQISFNATSSKPPEGHLRLIGGQVIRDEDSKKP